MSNQVIELYLGRLPGESAEAKEDRAWDAIDAYTKRIDRKLKVDRAHKDDVRFAVADMIQRVHEEMSEKARRSKKAGMVVLTHLDPNRIAQRGDVRHSSSAMAKLVKGGHDLTPILVGSSGDDYWILDGHHRLRAYQMAKKPVPALVGRLVEGPKKTVYLTVAKTSRIKNPSSKRLLAERDRCRAAADKLAVVAHQYMQGNVDLKRLHTAVQEYADTEGWGGPAMSWTKKAKKSASGRRGQLYAQKKDWPVGGPGVEMPKPKRSNPKRVENKGIPYATLQRELKSGGFSYLRSRGSHDVYESPTGKHVTIPRKSRGAQLSPHYMKQIRAAMNPKKKKKKKASKKNPAPPQFDRSSARMQVSVGTPPKIGGKTIDQKIADLKREFKRAGIDLHDTSILRYDEYHKMGYTPYAPINILTDGMISTIMLTGDYMDEFEDAFDRVGLWYEPSNHWNIQVYPKDTKDEQKWNDFLDAFEAKYGVGKRRNPKKRPVVRRKASKKTKTKEQKEQLERELKEYDTAKVKWQEKKENPKKKKKKTTKRNPSQRERGSSEFWARHHEEGNLDPGPEPKIKGRTVRKTIEELKRKLLANGFDLGGTKILPYDQYVSVAHRYQDRPWAPITIFSKGEIGYFLDIHGEQEEPFVKDRRGTLRKIFGGLGLESALASENETGLVPTNRRELKTWNDHLKAWHEDEEYWKRRNPKKKTAKKKAAKKAPQRKGQTALSLIANCQRKWESYRVKPSKKRLKEVFDHLEKMKESTSKKVADERRRCLRVANLEAKRIKLK